MIQMLMFTGAEVKLCTATGKDPLFITCQNGHENIVELLVNKGVDVNTGASPLFKWTCIYSAVLIIKWR